MKTKTPPLSGVLKYNFDRGSPKGGTARIIKAYIKDICLKIQSKQLETLGTVPDYFKPKAKSEFGILRGLKAKQTTKRQVSKVHYRKAWRSLVADGFE